MNLVVTVKKEKTKIGTQNFLICILILQTVSRVNEDMALYKII